MCSMKIGISDQIAALRRRWQRRKLTKMSDVRACAHMNANEQHKRHGYDTTHDTHWYHNKLFRMQFSIIQIGFDTRYAICDDMCNVYNIYGIKYAKYSVKIFDQANDSWMCVWARPLYMWLENLVVHTVKYTHVANATQQHQLINSASTHTSARTWVWHIRKPKEATATLAAQKESIIDMVQITLNRYINFSVETHTQKETEIERECVGEN